MIQISKYAFWRYFNMYKKLKEIGYITHPSWGCSKEFSDGWKACREQIDEILN